jgi:hypothetical protein
MARRPSDVNISTAKEDRVETIDGIYPKSLSCVRIRMQKLEFEFPYSRSSKCNGGTCCGRAEVKGSARRHRNTL